jgi:hypothetical protein
MAGPKFHLLARFANAFFRTNNCLLECKLQELQACYDWRGKLDFFVHRMELRQAECRDEGADQAATREVYAFGEGAAQHREADALTGRGEPPENLVDFLSGTGL